MCQNWQCHIRGIHLFSPVVWYNEIEENMEADCRERMVAMNLIYVLGLGVILILFGVIQRCAGRKKQKACSASVMATIIRVDERCKRERDDNGMVVKERYIYSPTYQYMVNGRWFQTMGSCSSADVNRYRVGMQEMIRFDPHNPKKISSGAEEKVVKSNGRTFIIVGIVVIILGVLKEMGIV